MIICGICGFFLPISMTPVHVIHGQVSHNARLSVLRSGSVVTARVLSHDGDGSYSLSIAGQKISVKSETNLRTGSVFSAKVSLKDGLVQLSLVREQGEANELVQRFPSDGKSLSPSLSEFLSALGLEPNVESLKIFQFMQQLGMKIDLPLAKKALAVSKKSGENGSEKAQLALLLEEKGITADDERISALLGKNQGNSEKRERRRKSKEDAKDFSGREKTERAVFNCESVKRFFDSADSAAISRKAGLLTAFNTLLSSAKKDIPLNHWIVLPFEWDFRDSFGSIKMLFDSDFRKLQKLVVDILSAEKHRIFALDFKDSQLDSVKFASNEENSLSGAESMLPALFGRSVRFERVDFDLLSGFPCDDACLSFVQGDV